MSVEATSWAWKQNCSPTEKLVLIAFADHADNEGVCWPGMQGIAKKTGVSRRTIIRVVKSLNDKKLLFYRKRTAQGIKKTNLYTLPIHDVTQCHNDVTLTTAPCDIDDIYEVTQCHINRNKEPSYKQPPDIVPFQKIINHLNDKTGKAFRPTTPKTRQIIQARWREGFRLADFESVIDTKTDQWRGDPKMVEYLRPETLFGTKFEAYLNQGSEEQSVSPYRLMPNLLD
jgi:uncharacterized phage protein (TIGR02220 family)